MDYMIREYQSGDEKIIIELFQLVFQKEISLEFWKWRFNNCPFGKAIIYLAFENENLVGHYAIHPVDLSVENYPIKAVFSMTTMIHPLHQRKGLFSRLASMAYEKASSLGYELVYGFPNKNSYHGFMKNLEWRDMGKMNMLEIKNRGLDNIHSNLEFKKIHEPSQIDDLFLDSHKNYVIVPRTHNFIQWRFFSKPSDEYNVYKIMQNDNCVCYFVLKKFGSIIHVVDLIGKCNDDIVKTILSIINDLCNQEGLSDVTCWLNETSEFYNLFLRYGFSIRESETYFGFKNFITNDRILSVLTQKKKWYLTMADSDVY